MAAATLEKEILCPATASARQHGHALFHPQKGDKKQAEVMVNALGVGCFQAAVRANPGFLVKGLGFGLNTGDEKHFDIA
jgi:hypothetical protein